MKKVIYLSLTVVTLGVVSGYSYGAALPNTWDDPTTTAGKVVHVPQLTAEEKTALWLHVDKLPECIKNMLPRVDNNLYPAELIAIRDVINTLPQTDADAVAAAPVADFVEDGTRLPNDDERAVLLYISSYPDGTTTLPGHVLYMVEHYPMEPEKEYGKVRFNELGEFMRQHPNIVGNANQMTESIQRLRMYCNSCNSRRLATILNGLQSIKIFTSDIFTDSVRELILKGADNSALLEASNPREQYEMYQLLEDNYDLILANYDMWKKQPTPYMVDYANDYLYEHFNNTDSWRLAIVLNGLQSIDIFTGGVQELIRKGEDNSTLLKASSPQDRYEMYQLLKDNYDLILANYDMWKKQQETANATVASPEYPAMAAAADPKTQRPFLEEASTDEEDDNCAVELSGKRQRQRGYMGDSNFYPPFVLPQNAAGEQLYSSVPVVQCEPQSTNLRTELVTTLMFIANGLGIDVNQYKANYKGLNDTELEELKKLVSDGLRQNNKVAPTDGTVGAWKRVQEEISVKATSAAAPAVDCNTELAKVH